MVGRARELLGAEMAALVGESYERAYGGMVRAQQLTELEEAVDYKLALSLSNGALPACRSLRVLQLTRSHTSSASILVWSTAWHPIPALLVAQSAHADAAD